MQYSKTILFLRHGKLNLPFPNHNAMPFSLLCDLASGKENPGIDLEFANARLKKIMTDVPLTDVQMIYCSPSQRAQQTAKVIANAIKETGAQSQEPEVRAELAEVHFDLRGLFPDGDVHPPTVEEINARVLHPTEHDTHLEPDKDVQQRVENVFQLCEDEQTQDILCVTHDYFLRYVEVYMRNGFTWPADMIDALSKTRRQGYMEGFLVKGGHLDEIGA